MINEDLAEELAQRGMDFISSNPGLKYEFNAGHEAAAFGPLSDGAEKVRSAMFSGQKRADGDTVREAFNILRRKAEKRGMQVTANMGILKISPG